MLKKFLPLLTALLVAVILAPGLGHLGRGDLGFFTDIGRDFLILDEIATKKFVLLGPRASGINGLFHGPAWAYLNFPVYALSGGEPAVFGWFWLALTLGFLSLNYFLIRDLTGNTVASVTTIALAIFMLPRLMELYNPFGALFVLPIFLWTLEKYRRTNHWGYLAGHVLTVGLLIQFQMAVGLPLLLLSLLISVVFTAKRQHYHHLLTWILLILPLITFIIFELRHDFPMLQALLHLGQNTTGQMTLATRLANRAELLLRSGWTLFTPTPWSWAAVVFAGAALWLWWRLRRDRRRRRRWWLLTLAGYFYVGYFFLSLFFTGELPLHRILPLVFFPAFILGLEWSVARWWGRLALTTLLLGCLLANWNLLQTKQADPIWWWQFQSQLGEVVFADGEPDFGYFIFAPDVYGYSQKASLRYWTKRFPQRQVAVFTKRPVTYLIYEPVPPERQADISPLEWRKNAVGIPEASAPAAVFELPHGFYVEKYELDPATIASPSAWDIDQWLTFR